MFEKRTLSVSTVKEKPYRAPKRLEGYMGMANTFYPKYVMHTWYKNAD